jgi:RNA polymerase sigma-70 factor (ECF subfamily)
MSDADLVRQCLAGQPRAYEDLVRRWAGRIVGLCHVRIGCSASADDLAQETLLRGYRALGSLADPEKFGPWLCQIAHRACLNWLKARQRLPVAFSALGPEDDPEDALYRRNHGDAALDDHDDDLERLRAEVAALPPECREVLTLYYHERLTYKDLAEILDVSPATINARLTRARTLLRERMHSYCQR